MAPCQLEFFSNEDFNGVRNMTSETREYNETSYGSEPFKSYKNNAANCCWEIIS